MKRGQFDHISELALKKDVSKLCKILEEINPEQLRIFITSYATKFQQAFNLIYDQNPERLRRFLNRKLGEVGKIVFSETEEFILQSGIYISSITYDLYYSITLPEKDSTFTILRQLPSELKPCSSAIDKFGSEEIRISYRSTHDFLETTISLLTKEDLKGIAINPDNTFSRCYFYPQESFDSIKYFLLNRQSQIRDTKKLNEKPN